jgi:hypothetical protein
MPSTAAIFRSCSQHLVDDYDKIHDNNDREACLGIDDTIRKDAMNGECKEKERERGDER